ncbi:TIGR00730 family Rossman fold protein [Hylemonella sp. W303a]|uniref:LOG family protein n=1 Tax=Hylemonella sp. W303a TaxID=3389873 RepID=UPI00396B40AA
MQEPHFSLCVYCGSRPGADPRQIGLARVVGRWIGSHGGQLVYGGGRAGLMGAVAEATLQAGGRVIGIIPEALVEREWAYAECTELHVVSTMHERKRMMAERSDAFLALPGGIGTFEELFEVWTWRQLGYHDKPIGIVNAHGYYDGLLSFLQRCVAQELMDQRQMGLIDAGSVLESDDEVEALLRRLVQAAGWSQDSAALGRVI